MRFLNISSLFETDRLDRVLLNIVNLDRIMPSINVVGTIDERGDFVTACARRNFETKNLKVQKKCPCQC
jgi:hypothetical protein